MNENTVIDENYDLNTVEVLCIKMHFLEKSMEELLDIIAPEAMFGKNRSRRKVEGRYTDWLVDMAEWIDKSSRYFISKWSEKVTISQNMKKQLFRDLSKVEQAATSIGLQLQDNVSTALENNLDKVNKVVKLAADVTEAVIDVEDEYDEMLS